MSDKSLSKLGAEVIARLGDGPSQGEVMEQRRRFLLAAKHQTPARWRMAITVVAAAAAVIGIGFWGLSLVQGGNIPFWIGGTETPGVEGQWVEAGAVKTVSIHFEGGSEFVLDKNGAARVVAANHEKVIFDLSQGRVKCRVNGNGKTGWIVRAGTYRVRVTGTEFSVNWDPGDSRLEVGVTDGCVLVVGASLGEHGVKLSAGDHLSAGGAQPTVIRNKLPEEDEEELAAQEIAARGEGVRDSLRPPTSQAEQRALVKARKRQDNRKTEQTSWQELYAEKDYSKVVDLITEQGLDRFIASAGSRDLWRVGKAARYSRRGDTAHRVLEGLVERFPKSQQAQNATFVLGRVAMELQDDPGAAQEWFNRYLSKNPDGPLAEEALGRLIDVCRHMGHGAAARKYADRYLTRYPGGPYAELAQSVSGSKEQGL